MAVAFGSAGTSATADSGNLASIALPAGLAAGDVMLLIASQNDNVTDSLSGWTNIAAFNNGTAFRMEVWKKIAGASESAPTLTHTGGSTSKAQIMRLTGASDVGTVGSTNTGTSSAGSATITALGITPTDGNSGIVMLAASTEANTDGGSANLYASWSGTNPTLTECTGMDTGHAQLTHEATLSAAFGLSGTGAATGNRTVALSGAGTGALAWGALLLEILPGTTVGQGFIPHRMPLGC